MKIGRMELDGKNTDLVTKISGLLAKIKDFENLYNVEVKKVVEDEAIIVD